MLLALASPVAVGPLAPGSADVIEPRMTVIQKYRSEPIELLRTKPASVCTVHGNLPLTVYQMKR